MEPRIIEKVLCSHGLPSDMYVRKVILMSTIRKPMLAGTIKDVTKLIFPLGATYKLDGIRCLRPEPKDVVSRSFKPIANVYIRNILSKDLKVGMDGEIISGLTFQDVTHAVMSYEGEPDFKYYVFDYVVDDLTKGYMDRMKDLKAWYDAEGHKYPYIVPLFPTIINNLEELQEFEAKALGEGYEGVILRSLNGPYKNGRSSFKEHYLLKLKQFLDSEAIIIGFEELLINNNVATTNELGHTERSSCKDNLAPGYKLGSIYVQDLKSRCCFSIGTGFDDALRCEIWNNKAKYLGKIAKYSYFPIGVKESTGVPRHPVFKGIRDKDDM